MKRFGTLILLLILCTLLLLPYLGVQLDALFQRSSVVEGTSESSGTEPPRLRSATEHTPGLPAIEDLLKESHHGQD